MTFVVLCLLAFGLGGYLVSSSVYHSLEREILNRLSHESFSYAVALENKVESFQRRTEDFASDGFIRTRTADLVRSGFEESRRQLTRHLQQNKLPLEKGISRLVLHDPDGERLLGVGMPDQDSILQRLPAFAPDSVHVKILADKGGEGHSPVVAFTAPLWNIDHTRIVGYLTSLVDARGMLSPVLNRHGIIRDDSPGEKELTIIGPGNRGIRIPHQVITGRLPGESGANSTAGMISRLQPGELPRLPEHQGKHIHGNGHLYFAAAFPMHNTGWTALVEIDAESAFFPISELEGKFLGTGISIGFATLLLLYFPVQFLVRPLNRLTEMAKRIKDGDFSARVSIGSSDEIGRLAEMFNHMAAAVEQRTRNLQKTARDLHRRESELRTVVEAMQDGLVLLDWKNDIKLSNQAAEPIRQLLDGTVKDFSVRRCGQDGGTVGDCRHCLLTAGMTGTCNLTIDGTIYEVLSTALPVTRDQGGKVLVARDITERERMHQQQTQEERLAVLGKVSAVVAHELNSPLAAISMYGQMMQRELADDSAFQEHTEVILRNTESCQRIIEDILDYAKTPRPEITEVNPNALVRDVLRFLKPVYENKEVSLQYYPAGGNPEIEGDRKQLQQIMVNLIMNAIQAIPDGEGVITITARDKDQELEIDVQDNGKGIPRDQAEKIFEPFYTTKSVGGTGLGLSTARSIARTHGGELSLLTSTPGKTLFRLTLPEEVRMESSTDQANPETGRSNNTNMTKEIVSERRENGHGI